jgi:hypothetical protein
VQRCNLYSPPSMMNRLFLLLSVVLCTLFYPDGAAALKDKATGIDFAEKVNGLGIFGVGVRTKGPIKVYAVGAYGSDGAKKSLKELSGKKALAALENEAQKGPFTFLLKFNFKVGAEKVSSSITDAVSARFSGSKDVEKLRTILCDGVMKKGSTSKGTTMQFDCTSGGVKVSLDGTNLGQVQNGGLSKALCGVYLDKKSVAPTLTKSCIENCCEVSSE